MLIFIALACTKSGPDGDPSDSGDPGDSGDECATLTFYMDLDGDGFGDADNPVEACELPDGAVEDSTDCDDGEATVFPDADEVCDDLDNDCDGSVDNDPTDGEEFYVDEDGDGYGTSDTLVACAAEAGMATATGDCNDADASINPGAAEICDGIDSDCDGVLDDGTAVWIAQDGTAIDQTTELTGTSDAPAVVTYDEAGRLVFCDGTWYVNLTLNGDIRLHSQAGSADAVTLDGALNGTVVQVDAEGVTVGVADVTITNGWGNSAVYSEVDAGLDSGGGLACNGGGSSALILSGVEVLSNGGVIGGGLAAVGCDVSIDGSTFDGNIADIGGAMTLDQGTSTVSNSTLSNNDAGFGGALLALGYYGRPSVTLENAVLDSNTASQGGGATMLQADLVCDGSSITTNEADDGGGIFVDSDGTLSATDCDFGTSAGGDDNLGFDLELDESEFAYMPGDGTTFECDDERCGTSVEHDMGYDGADIGAGVSDVFYAMVIEADSTATLDGFDVYLDNAGTCEWHSYVLSAPSATAAVWAVEWSSYQGTMSGGENWKASDDIGMPVESGTFYALGIGLQCDSSSDITAFYDGYAGAEDAGFGDYGGTYLYEAGTYEPYGGTVTTLASDTGTIGFALRTHVTEL